MLVVINGDPVEIVEASTISALLEQLQIDSERIAVEVNLDIVPKSAHGVHVLLPGDRIEIVHFVGGG